MWTIKKYACYTFNEHINRIGPLGQVGLLSAMSVRLFVCLSVCENKNTIPGGKKKRRSGWMSYHHFWTVMKQFSKQICFLCSFIWFLSNTFTVPRSKLKHKSYMWCPPFVRLSVCPLPPKSCVWYLCFYPHWSRNFVSPVCRIKKIYKISCFNLGLGVSPQFEMLDL